MIMWTDFWPFIVGFFLVIIAGVILQILMLRCDKRNKLSANFNRLVGSLYIVILVLITTIVYLIFGTRVI